MTHAKDFDPLDEISPEVRYGLPEVNLALSGPKRSGGAFPEFQEFVAGKRRMELFWHTPIPRGSPERWSRALARKNAPIEFRKEAADLWEAWLDLQGAPHPARLTALLAAYAKVDAADRALLAAKAAVKAAEAAA